MSRSFALLYRSFSADCIVPFLRIVSASAKPACKRNHYFNDTSAKLRISEQITKGYGDFFIFENENKSRFIFFKEKILPEYLEILLDYSDFLSEYLESLFTNLQNSFHARLREREMFCNLSLLAISLYRGCGGNFPLSVLLLRSLRNKKTN